MQRIARRITVGVALTLVAALAGCGAFLVVGYGKDDRGQWWFREHLKVVQGQLADLKTQLRAWKEVHGRYPTNDEGLAALDSFAARFKVRLVLQKERDEVYHDELPGFAVWMWNDFWRNVGSRLAKHHGAHGRYPQDAREFNDVGYGCDPEDTDEDVLSRHRFASVIEKELVISSRGNVFVWGPSGALCPWWMPYIYENRAGADPAAFTDSPAGHDDEGRFSIRVDEEVYLSSIGGRIFAEELDALRWQENLPRYYGAGMLLAAVAVIVVATRIVRTRARRRTMAVVGVAMLGVWAALGVVIDRRSYATCYVMSPFFGRRTRQMVARQKRFLDGYRAAGVISDATYQRSLAAMEIPEPSSREKRKKEAGAR